MMNIEKSKGFNLSAKIVVITGASSGIGAAVARVCVYNGGRVVIASRTLEKLNELSVDLGGREKALPVYCDVTSRKSVENLLVEALNYFGRVDCWINNAGVGITKSFLEIDDEDFDSMMSVNAKSVMYGMQTIIPYFKDRGDGQVINVSSMLGRVPFASIRAMYSASKAAMNSLTINARVDLKNQGFRNIHINLFIPGVVSTEFGLHAIGGGPDNRQLPGAQSVEEVAEMIAHMIGNPCDEVYSRTAYKAAVASYYSAENVTAIESSPPFVRTPEIKPP